jgi:polyisoprenoid-binding protein YceI
VRLNHAAFLGPPRSRSNERTVFSARTTINREEWGLTWNMLLDAGGLLVSREIVIEIEVELIRQAV